MNPGPAQALSADQARRAQNAFQLLDQGDASRALEEARRLVGEVPRAPDAQQLLGLCHARTGDAVSAEKALRRALELAPGHPLVLVNLAACLRDNNRMEEALRTYRAATQRAPDFAKAWIGMGRCALETGDHEQARGALRRAVDIRPHGATAWRLLGKALRASHDLEGAEAAFRKTVELAPGNGTAWIDLGVVCRLRGRSDQALACYRKARETGLESPELADATIGVLLDSGETGAALEVARQLARDHPRYAPGQVTLAHLLWEHGATLAPGEDPLETFRKTAADAPDDHSLRLEFARFLLTSGEAEAALEQIKALRARSDSTALLMLEANALEILGRTDASGEHYRRIYRSGNGKHPSFLNAYVRHLLKAGEWQEAERRASEAVRLDRGNQEAWAYLATAWRLLDDPREHWLCDYQRLITLIEVEPPPRFESATPFLTELKAALEPIHQARREPVQQSLRGGSQTPGRLFGRPDPVIADAEQAFRRAVERWLKSLPEDAEHPFLSRKANSVRFSGSWSVKLWSSGSHVNHVHSQGWMSSAFYVSLPPSVRKQNSEADPAGYIQFGQPPVELGLDLPARRVIRPEPGYLALFPSYMWHGTVPFEDDEPRMTIAFDMMPKG